MKSDGRLFPQVLISKLSAMGISMLIPRMLAFSAVQRQTAASRSKSPPSTEQQGMSGGVPMTAPMGPFSTLAQTPSFRASLGQCPFDGLGLGFGFGFGFGFGVGGLLQPLQQPLTRVKKRMLKSKKRVTKYLFESITKQRIYVLYISTEYYFLGLV